MAFVEDFFTILKEIHCSEKGHIGEKKTVLEVILERLLRDSTIIIFFFKGRFPNSMNVFLELLVSSL